MRSCSAACKGQGPQNPGRASGWMAHARMLSAARRHRGTPQMRRAARQDVHLALAISTRVSTCDEVQRSGRRQLAHGVPPLGQHQRPAGVPKCASFGCPNCTPQVLRGKRRRSWVRAAGKLAPPRNPRCEPEAVWDQNAAQPCQQCPPSFTEPPAFLEVCHTTGDGGAREMQLQVTLPWAACVAFPQFRFNEVLHFRVLTSVIIRSPPASDGRLRAVKATRS
eukprot:366406-Chlamydomonas_euryale.AAC.29